MINQPLKPARLSQNMRAADLVVLGLLFIGPTAPVNVFGVLTVMSHGAVATVYLLATLMMVFTVYSYINMSRVCRNAGAVYAYTALALSPAVGFLTGWLIFLDYLLIPAVAYLFCGISLNTIFPAIPVWIFVLVAVLLTTALNLVGNKRAARWNLLILILELIMLLLVVGASVVVLLTSDHTHDWLVPFSGSGQFTSSALFAAVSVAVLSYLGFDAIALFAEEHKGNASTVGRAMLFCLILAGILFVLQTYVAALLSPYSVQMLAEQPQLQGKAYYLIINQKVAPWLGDVFALQKAVGAVFAAMVGQAAASRLMFSMARDGRLPHFLGYVSRRTGVPGVAIVVVALLDVVLAILAAWLPDGLSRLVSCVDLGALVAFVMLHASVIGYYVICQRQYDGVSLCRYLVLPLVGMGLLLPVLWHIQWLAKVVGLVWLGLGVVMGGYHKKKARAAHK
ncbi:APC family permease [Neisseriaceae bacterium ESL0693]|nr:APC family permease [Neisseriaceae bacterium ESL0693]